MAFFKILFFTGFLAAIHYAAALGPYSTEDENDGKNVPNNWEEITWWLSPEYASAPGRPRPPRPHPPRVPFFIGNFESNPERDVQINMYRTYQCMGVPPINVDATIRVNITLENRTTFHYKETADNDTIWDFGFQLGVTNSTTFQGGDVDVLIFAKNHANDLEIQYNSTATGRVRISFDFSGPRRGFEATYRCDRNSTASSNLDRPSGNVVKGLRHFTRSRRPRAAMDDFE